MEKRINLKYAAMQGTYWMVYCAIPGFASVFLLDKNYNDSQIGYILAIGFIISVLIQPVVADFADKTKKMSLITIMIINTIILIAAGVVLCMLPKKSIALTVFYVLFIVGIMVLQPLVNALNFYLEKMKVHVNFGVARSMGSLFYAIICTILGYATEYMGSVVLPLAAVIVLMIIMFILISLTADRKKLSNGQEIVLDDEFEKNTIEKESLIQFASRYKAFFIFLLGATGLYFGHTVINNFFYQITLNAGGDSTDLGKIQSFSAMMELPAMILFDKIRRKAGCKNMLIFSAICFSIKILVTLMSGNVFLLYVSMIFQSVSFAVFIPASVHYVDEIMQAEDAVKGQSMLTGMIALANVLSSLIGGQILFYKDVMTMLILGTVVTVIGMVISVFGVKARIFENREEISAQEGSSL